MTKPALLWLGDGEDMGIKRLVAKVGPGVYRIGPVFSGLGFKLVGYSVYYAPDGKKDHRLIGDYPTLDRAKAAAERDYGRSTP